MFGLQPVVPAVLGAAVSDAVRSGAALLGAALFGAALAVGCGGPTFDGQMYRDGDVGFRLAQVPAGWRRIEVSDAALAFRDDAATATIAVHARCGRDAPDVPLVSLTQHLFIQFTERNSEDQRLIPLAGREALSTQLTAKLDGVPKHFHVVVLKKNGCVYDFMRIADAPQDGQLFLDFVGGFSTLE
jgi:hypothetical protein